MKGQSANVVAIRVCWPHHTEILLTGSSKSDGLEFVNNVFNDFLNDKKHKDTESYFSKQK